MWKEYSINYMKKNKAASLSIMVAAFIASLFISLVCGIFYNIWADNIRQLVVDEGDWQGRLVGNVTKEDIQTIKSFSNVKEVVVDIGEMEEGNVISVYFNHPSNIYEDLPKIAARIGMDESGIQYHNTLLSEYFIYSPEGGEKPSLLLKIYIAILMVTCFSLILVIRNAFGVSMNARTYQLGILQSIGATPKQICSVFLQEAFALCLLPILAGIVTGIGGCYGFILYTNSITKQTHLEYSAVFQYHVLVFLITLGVSLLTVWVSAWLPAQKMSKLSPLEVIRSDEREPAQKVKRFRILSSLFGVEGELARKSLYVRRKAFRTSTLSLTLSFLVFSVFLDLITLMDISTKHTYFEKYKDTWDIMVSTKDVGVRDTELITKLRGVDGISGCTGYRIVTAYTNIPDSWMSDEIKTLGGYEGLNHTKNAIGEESYLVHVPIVVLDDESFYNYCNQNGIVVASHSETFTVTVNTIWDSVNSNFRYRKYVPFLRETSGHTLTLFSDQELTKEAARIKICGYTDQTPDLREEYEDYGLLQIMAASAFDSITANFSTDEEEVYFKLIATSDEEVNEIEEKIHLLLKGEYEYTLENRIEEEITNAEILNGYKKLMGGLCVLFACIGIANVFANTLGYIFQRKREFARYISIGLTPDGVKKVLCLEAMVVGLKPILFSIPLSVLFVVFAVNESHLQLKEFIEHMPIVPISIFAVFILLAVGVSYYIGGRKILRIHIVEVLKDDTMF